MLMEKILAGVLFAICAVMLLRLAIGERRRWRFDQWFARLWQATRARARALWHWRRSRQTAEREAEAAIRRAREGDWDGNVYKPKSFRKPPRDKMH